MNELQVQNGGVEAEETGHQGRNPSARYSFGFWSLVATQFQGAFNDNALKFLVIYLVVDMTVPGPKQNWLVLAVGALFALPFILLSMTGGFLADRFSKRSVTIGTKWMELGVMLFALAALARANLAMEAAGVFLLSSQAAIFGPSKYGLLPELLPEKDLCGAMAWWSWERSWRRLRPRWPADFWRFIFAGVRSGSGVILLGCTLIGLATSFGVTRVPGGKSDAKIQPQPAGRSGEQIRRIRGDRVLNWAVVGNFYLRFLAALLQFTIVIYGHDILRIDDRHISYLQAAVAVGLGLGSLATGYLSDAKIEYGLIPVGAAGMMVFGFLSAGHGISLERAAIYLGLLGFFGGFYAVPLNALIQHRPDPGAQGRSDRRGEPHFVRGRVRSRGRLLCDGGMAEAARGRHLSGRGVHDAGGDALRRGLPAGFHTTVGAVGAYAQHLPHSRGGPRQYSPAGAALSSSRRS